MRHQGAGADVVVEHLGDLELAARRRLQLVDDREDIWPQEVHADGYQVALGLIRLLLEADDATVTVNLGDPKSPRVIDAIQETPRAVATRLERGSDARQIRPAQHVVAEHDGK